MRYNRGVENVRRYGSRPFTVAVIHGGPGAGGELAPVARELAPGAGVLEPLQTAATIDGQVAELATVIETCGDAPLALIGFSWGAWLGLLVAARYPSLVKKLILVGCGPPEQEYAAGITKTRLDRLGEKEREEVSRLMTALDGSSTGDGDKLMARLGELMLLADSYDPLPHDRGAVHCRYDIYRSVWAEAVKLRSTGGLLRAASTVTCPVVAVHGSYDPHPAEGVSGPLSRVLRDFRFILLDRCGHYPWLERHARETFFRVLRTEAGAVS